MVKKYLAIYQQFVATCFAEASSYRVHFFLLIFMDLAFYASTLLTIDILYQHTPVIGLWRREEFMFFIAFMLTIDQLHMTFVSESFWELSAAIRNGDLDWLLIKPVNLFFLIFFRHIRPASLLLCFVTSAILIHYSLQVNLSWVSLILMPLLVVYSLGFLVLLEILISASMFWLVEGTGVNFLRMQLQQVSRWPDFMFSGITRRVLLSLVPILLIGNAPVRFLLDTSDFNPMITLMFLTVLLLWLNGKVWRFALSRYESASS